jgi:hypothetical protein
VTVTEKLPDLLGLVGLLLAAVPTVRAARIGRMLSRIEGDTRRHDEALAAFGERIGAALKAEGALRSWRVTAIFT